MTVRGHCHSPLLQPTRMETKGEQSIRCAYHDRISCITCLYTSDSATAANPLAPGGRCNYFWWAPHLGQPMATRTRKVPSHPDASPPSKTITVCASKGCINKRVNQKCERLMCQV